MRLSRRVKKSYELVPSPIFLRAIFATKLEIINQGFKKQNKPKRLIFVIVLLGALITPILAATVFGFQLHVVTSGSMRPAFNPGDAIVTKVQPAEQVKVGQVILVTNNVTQVQYSHRVTSVSSADKLFTFVTKGDANAMPDEAVIASSQIRIQTSLFVLPNIGYALSILRSPISIGISLLILLLIIVWLEIDKKDVTKQVHILKNAQKGILDVKKLFR